MCKNLLKVGKSIARLSIRAMFLGWTINVKVLVASVPVQQNIDEHVWHSVSGACLARQVEHFLQLKIKASKHRKHVNGAIK